MVRPCRLLLWSTCLAAPVAGCRDDAPGPSAAEAAQASVPRDGVARPLTEPEKIAELIERVRRSGHTFIRNGKEHSSIDAAEHLAMKLEKAGPRVRSARDFIDGVASRSSISGEPYRLRAADGTEHVVRDWLMSQLRELERPPARPAGSETPAAAVPPPPEPPRIDIEYALSLIERSDLSFQVPRAERDPVVYTAAEFARMLRRKWTWLGPDIQELGPWLDEIASRSFRSDLPYQVLLPDQRVLELRPWLEAQLAE